MTSPALDDWLMWGDDVSEDYLQCAQLHADCVTASTRAAPAEIPPTSAGLAPRATSAP